jgi:DNA-directed RNA polymerase subunit RPC12/RpoP
MATRCICPHCKTPFTIHHIEDMVGMKILCKHCGGKILMQAPKPAKKKAARPRDSEIILLDDDAIVEDDFQSSATRSKPAKKQVDKAAKAAEPDVIELDDDAIVEDDFEIEAVEVVDDEFADSEAARLPARPQKLLTAKKPKKKTADTLQGPVGKESGGPPQKAKSGALGIWIAVGAIGLCTIAGGAVLLLSATGVGQKFKAPEKYVDFAPAGLQLSCSVPKGWDQSYGGGSAGVPIHARFTFGKISIDIRESISGGALGQAGMAMQQQANGQAAQGATAIGLHEFHGQRIKEDFKSFHEENLQPIKTAGYSEACMSDFTADQGFFGGGKTKGCRATVVSTLHQFDVICKCPVGMFEEVRPVFEKIIMSLGG